MAHPPRLLILTAAGLLLAGAASADPLDDAALGTEAQYYLMALPPSPVGEVAEAVLGEALGLPYKVDPDVKALMAFRLDGSYAPKALAQEFGHRLWNVDVALVEKPSDGLWLIPKGELAAAQAQGAVLVAPVAAMEAGPPATDAAPASVATGSRAAEPHGSDWGWLGWIGLGWLGGAASVAAWLGFRARPRTAAPTGSSATSLALPEPDQGEPDELVIPVFSESSERTRRV